MQFWVVDAVEHRGVILVDEYHHLLARLVVGSLNQTGHTHIIVHRILWIRDTIFLFLLSYNEIESGMHPLLLIVLAVREVKTDDGIFLPLFLLIIYIQPLEQFLATLEIAAQGIHQ